MAETSVASAAKTRTTAAAPQLEWSSDSSASEDNCYECQDEQQQQQHQHLPSPRLAQHRRHSRNLMDLTEDEEATGETTTTRRTDPNALLRTVAAVHLQRNTGSGRFDSNYGEARTSISSPGRRLTLRERVRARARLQRRIHEARAANEISLDDSHASTSSSSSSRSSTDQQRQLEDLDDSGIVLEEEHLQQQYPILEQHDYYPPMERNRSNRSRSSTATGPKPASSKKGMRVQIVPTQAVAPKNNNKPQANRILLHVYDLIEKDTLMMLPPFGCVVEIGKCFADMNSALHAVGTGAYHVGVEVNGVEYAYGATSVPNQTGVFTCFPRLSPGYQYRTTIDLGERPLLRRSWVAVDQESSTVYQQVSEYVQGRTVIKEMAAEYMGSDYDILRKNCCTFARDACLRLGVPDEQIPTWFRNLAESGALTQDAVRATVEPLTSVLSLACEDISPGSGPYMIDGDVRCPSTNTTATEEGIETIFQTTTEHHSVVVVEHPQERYLRRTSTWAY